MLAEYAVDHGIPWSDLRDWSDEDLAMVQAVLARRAVRCPSCHTCDDDWIDPETRLSLTPPRFRPELRVCHGCRARQRATEPLKDVNERDRAGSFVAMVPTGKG